MNGSIRDLLALAPSLIAGIKGNPADAAALMEGWQEAARLDEQRKRQQGQDALVAEDRTLARTRQERLDAQALEDRNRRQALEALQIPGHLAELGGAADSPEGAQATIEAAMPNLMKVFGQETMAFGQPAVEQAQRVITGRQRKQIEDYLAKWENSDLGKQNKDSDPEMQLPEHLARVMGKPSARYSELKQFAQLPPGRPAGKERMPAQAGSFEDYVQRLHGDNATPEQILAARKAYNQSDDKPTVNVTLPGGVPTKIGDYAMKFQDDFARDSKPYLTMREAFQRVNATTPDAAGDLSLIFAYMKILDPNSVVREQEFANAQNAAGVPDRVRNLYNQVMQGTRLNPEQRRQFKEQARALFEGAVRNQKQVRGTYSSRAKQLGVPENMVLDAEDEFLSAPPVQQAPAGAATGPQVGERRKSPNGDLIEWDGKGWKLVRM